MKLKVTWKSLWLHYNNTYFTRRKPRRNPKCCFKRLDYSLDMMYVTYHMQHIVLSLGRAISLNTLYMPLKMDNPICANSYGIESDRAY